MNYENTLALCRDFPSLYVKEATKEECERRSQCEFLSEASRKVMGLSVNGEPLMLAMQWGFECGDGWFDLIHRLSVDIAEHAQTYGLHPYASQVKEKFGSLRFHMQFREKVATVIQECGIDPQTGRWANGEVEYLPGVKEIRALLRHAEEASASICEGCGAPGSLITDGWHHVHCAQCEAEYRRKRGVT